MDGTEPPRPPAQFAVHDLTSSPNGKAKTENAPRFKRTNMDYKSPAEMMRGLGFSPDKYMTPLQFMIAVYSDDLDLIFRNEKRRKQAEEKGGISLMYRIQCAQTAAKYLHMEMPKVQINDEAGGYGDTLLLATQNGDERLRKRQVIIETIERISPDMPLDNANYPPHLNIKQKREISEEGIVEGEVLNPEGDTGYNPDAE